jgi:hypothetical protein
MKGWEIIESFAKQRRTTVLEAYLFWSQLFLKINGHCFLYSQPSVSMSSIFMDTTNHGSKYSRNNYICPDMYALFFLSLFSKQYCMATIYIALTLSIISH